MAPEAARGRGKRGRTRSSARIEGGAGADAAMPPDSRAGCTAEAAAPGGVDAAPLNADMGCGVLVDAGNAGAAEGGTVAQPLGALVPPVAVVAPPSTSQLRRASLDTAATAVGSERQQQQQQQHAGAGADASPRVFYRCEVPHIPQRFSW